MSRGGGFFAFLIGFAAGVAGSYWYCDKKHRMRADAEIESVKEVWAKKYKRENPSQTKPTEEPASIGSSWSSIELETPRKSPNPTPYSTRERAAADSNVGIREASPHEEERDVYDENDPPFEITADEYLSSRSYEHVQLTWYKKDDCLVIDEYAEDENGMEDAIIHDQASVVGDVFDRSGFRNNDTFLIYIRNPMNSTDYEITKSQGGFMM